MYFHLYIIANRMIIQIIMEVEEQATRGKSDDIGYIFIVLFSKNN